MRGSRALAREYARDGVKPSWVASLEMVGCRRRQRGSQRYPFPFRWFYPDRADFILLLGNTRAHGLLARMADAFQKVGVETQRLTVPFGGCLSDGHGGGVQEHRRWRAA